MRKDAPLHVQVPSPDTDRPAWVKVGVIAAVGFVIGIAWPRVMGVKLGPNAPGEAAAAAAAAASASGGKRAPDAPPASVAAKSSAAVVPSAASSVATGAPNVSVQKGSILGCKGDDGESKKGKDCGGVAALDLVVAPRLRKLSTCGAADGQTGKLSFIVNADFAGGHLNWDIGKSSTVGNVEGITTCLKTIFQGVGLTGVAHENPKYTVAYATTFALDAKGPAAAPAAPPDEKAPEAAREKTDKTDEKLEAPAGGEGTVSWEVGLVRDAPKTGAVVARLPRGTKVKLGASKDGWYAIKYGDTFASDGFLYRGALGR